MHASRVDARRRREAHVSQLSCRVIVKKKKILDLSIDGGSNFFPTNRSSVSRVALPSRAAPRRVDRSSSTVSCHLRE